MRHTEVLNAGAQLLGIPWRPESDPPVTPRSFLVARLQGDAWLTEHRLDDDYLVIGLRREPTAIAWEDLELEVEERFGDERIIAERLKLEDADLPDDAHAHDGLTVTLPSLGRGIERLVRLHDRNGHLLDDWRPFRMFESYGFTISVGDTPAVEHRAASNVRG